MQLAVIFMLPQSRNGEVLWAYQSQWHFWTVTH